MNRRGKKILLVFIGTMLGLVLAALAFVFSVVREDAPYAFMRDARQDGFYAPIIDGTPDVNRFYIIERPISEVVRDAQKEIGSGNGWRSEELKGAPGTWLFLPWGTQSGITFWIEPVPGRASETCVEVHGDAKKVEEIIGTLYEWIPDRHGELRR